MWKSFISKLMGASAVKVITIALPIVIAASAVVAVPLLIDQKSESVEQSVEQSVDEETQAAQNDSQEKVDQNVESEPPGESEKSALSESTDKKEAEGKKDDGKGFIGKVVSAITGNSQAADNNDSGDSSVAPDSSDSGTVESKQTFSVNFFTAGGTAFEKKEVAPGTNISSFPTPYKANSVFAGWYYDEAGTLPVASTDTVDKDLSLYASYLEMSPLETIESKAFASAVDVGSDFSITIVTEDKDIDTAAVLAGINAENLTSPDQKDFVKVSGGNGTFVLTGINPAAGADAAGTGFEEGASFKIALNDGRLNFKDEPESVREYNFTTDKEDVLNLKYDEDVTYILASDVSNVVADGEDVDTLSVALYNVSTADGTEVSSITKGSFEYSKGTLKVGDVVIIYEGLRPDLRTLDTPLEECGAVAYVEITAKEGEKYSFETADPEDIIFEPDMLPIPVDVDLDSKENTVTVDDKYLDFSSDIYANIELDSQTTVDIGDFLVFYTGTFGVETGENAVTLTGKYGAVEKVTKNGDGTTTIQFTESTWEEVNAAMDVYTSDAYSGADLIDGVDVEDLEAQIAQQALDSGFAEEAAQYLASLALATDNFTELSDNMNLADYKVTLSDGSPISPEELQLMDASIKAEFELEDDMPKVKIGINPSNLGDVEGTGADGKGLAVELEIAGTLTISRQGSDNTIEISISGTFVEEVGIEIGASHKAIWSTWGPFPYISEYRVNATVDLLNYTGIEVNATMITKEAEEDGDDEEDGGDESEDEEEGDSIAEYIKGLLEEAEEEGEDEEDEEESSNLVKHYSEMLEEESDFLKIVDRQLFEKKMYCSAQTPIIAIEIQVDFIVEAEACISIGFDFEYMTGKRYVFAIDVFDLKVTSNTITLVEETYEFCFYAMGRLGIRAGIEVTFKIGLFDTALNSIGVQAGAGAYTKLWGYFYYELTYSESEGRDQSWRGAMLVEVGAFLEIDLAAQVLDGVLATEWEILDMEWPLWQAGNADNVLDFTTEQEDMPDVKLKQYIRSATLPDSTFLLHYLDLKEGEEMDAIYEDYFDASKPESDENRKNFTITMTNDKFSYDPQTNIITVSPAEGDKKLEGEMIITWIKYPLSFTSRPIQRTISLYWDNLRDGYVIVPYTNGGTYIPIIEAKYESKVDAPADPERLGYTFTGWYADEALTTPYTFPESMPASDANIYAKWEARTDIHYRVEHYQQQLVSGEYELFETEELKGTTDTYVTPDVKTYTGYDAPAKQEVKILADGSAVLRYYYDLQWASVTFDPGEIGGEAIVYDLKYGARIAAPYMAEKGYTFTGWDKEVVSTMGTEDVVYTAQWTKNPDTDYRVEYYVQQADGTYALAHLIESKGFTGDILTADELRERIVDEAKNLTADEKFMAEDAFKFGSMTVNGLGCKSAAIGGDGKTVIKINYTRVAHTVTFDYGYDEKSVSNEVCYEGVISVPIVERTGYDFRGWSIDGSTVSIPEKKMGHKDLSYIALWTPHTYTVAFEKNHAEATGNMGDLVLTYGSEQALTDNSFSLKNYVFAGWAEHSDGALKYSDGEKVLNLTAKDDEVVTLYATWKPETFTITYHGCENIENANPATYTVESEKIILSGPVKDGYIFKGWYDNASFGGTAVTTIEKGSFGNRSLYAKWEARTDIPYRVEHYKETPEGGWILADTDNLTGSIDTAIYPAVKAYDHYEAPAAQEIYISIDAATVVRYEYARKSYTITLDPGMGTLPEGVSSTITAKHGDAISLPAPSRDGHGFKGWYYDDAMFTASVMPTKDVTLTAQYAEGQFGYTVNYYLQNVDGNGYTIRDSVTGTAAMDSDFTAVINNYIGFTAPAESKTITIGANAAENVIDYYYIRNQYNLTWDLQGGNAEGYTSGSVYYGAAIVAPVPEKAGYTYTWNEVIESAMPDHDLAYTVTWTPNTYAVVFDVDGGVITSGSAETRNVTFASPYGELPVLEKQGYTFEGWYTAKDGGSPVTGETAVTTAANHTLYAKFSAVAYTITYKGIDGATNQNPATYSVATGNITLSAPVKDGYTFAGWYQTEDFSTNEVKTIAASRGENLVLFAKWTENRYTVIFHSNDGADETVSQNFIYGTAKALTLNTFVREGYDFVGWSANNAATKAEYKDGQTVSKLTAEADGEVHLYAVWASEEYDIVYKNLEGAANASDNPVKFNAGNNVITLHEPSRTGYTFEGWYTDANFKNKVSGSIVLDSYHTWYFYAKWSANKYVITFDSCLGESIPKETILMTYDEAANLTLISEMNNFTNPGYTFLGWSATKGGDVEYTDGQTVTNLVTTGNINLYAVWELNVFDITYDLGAGGVSHTNPATYTFEDDDVEIAAPVAKDGYQFLGWYEGETLVTEIVKGAQRDYSLKAKWGHGGFFSLDFTNAVEDGSDIKNIFTIRRTLPEGTVATTNPQYVYYRTLNGTAYGSTVDVEHGSEHDKYHFLHVGGEDVFLAFGPNDTEMTFTVEEWGLATMGDMVAGFRTEGTANKHYFVELYKVVDTVGGCEGTIDADARRCKMNLMNLRDGEGFVGASMFDWHTEVVRGSEYTVTDDNYPEFYMHPYNYIPSGKYLVPYMNQISGGARVSITMDVREENDGYQLIEIATYDEDGDTIRLELVAYVPFEIKPGGKNTSWQSISLPCGETTQGSNVKFTDVNNYWLTYNNDGYKSGTKSASIDPNMTYYIGFDASGSGGDDWLFRNFEAHYRYVEPEAPQQIGVAPMAFGKYEAGEKIYITVTYSDVIAEAELEDLYYIGLTGMFLTDVEYYDGVGTNSIVLQATVGEDFEITPDMNNMLVNTDPLSLRVCNVLGNYNY